MNSNLSYNQAQAIEQFALSISQIREQELARYTKKLSRSEAKYVAIITESIIQKVIGQPVEELSKANRQANIETMANVLSRLFCREP